MSNELKSTELKTKASTAGCMSTKHTEESSNPHTSYIELIFSFLGILFLNFFSSLFRFFASSTAHETGEEPENDCRNGALSAGIQTAPAGTNLRLFHKKDEALESCAAETEESSNLKVLGTESAAPGKTIEEPDTATKSRCGRSKSSCRLELGIEVDIPRIIPYAVLRFETIQPKRRGWEWEWPINAFRLRANTHEVAARIGIDG